MPSTRPIDFPAGGRVRSGTLYQDEGTAGDAAGRPCLVVVHGLAASRRLPEIERLCGALASGMDLVAVDLRGHGEAADRFTWGREEHRDLAELVTFLRGLYPAVGVLGFSIGGFVAIASAALASEAAARPDALCTVGAPLHLRIWRYRFGFRGSWSHARMMMRRRHRGLRPAWPALGWTALDRLVPKVSPIPLLVIHGDRDWLVPPAQGRALYEAAREPRELLMIPGGLHAEFLMAQDVDLVAKPVAEFFTRTLPAARKEAGEPPEVSLSRGRP